MIGTVNASTGRHFKPVERIEAPESAESAGIETAEDVRKLVNDKQTDEEAKKEEKDHE
jgi:hypothetical protein